MNQTTNANCCAHRGLDHGRGKIVAGAPCTIPDCRCKGWVPRANIGKAPRLEERAKAVALWHEGLTVASIAERQGLSPSTVTSAINESVGPVTGTRRKRRNDCPLPARFFSEQNSAGEKKVSDPGSLS